MSASVSQKTAPLRDVSLEDKYDLAAEQVFLSGTQAVVRLLLMQQERDRRAGLNTAGFVSGYRGSPLGGLDQQMFKAGKKLKQPIVQYAPFVMNTKEETYQALADFRDVRLGELA